MSVVAVVIEPIPFSLVRRRWSLNADMVVLVVVAAVSWCEVALTSVVALEVVTVVVALRTEVRLCLVALVAELALEV